MATVNAPHVEDLVSVGSRVSWSAILAGAAVALGFQVLLGILGATIGASMSANVESDSLRTGAVVWMIFSACLSLFAGGVVSTQLTASENKVEAVIYGIVMWATVTAIVAHGLSATREAMGETSSRDWETAARSAGVPAEQIQQWNAAKKPESRDANATSLSMNSSKIRWLTFATVWLSMAAAAIGAYVGAGPTFRLVYRRPANSVTG